MEGTGHSQTARRAEHQLADRPAVLEGPLAVRIVGESDVSAAMARKLAAAVLGLMREWGAEDLNARYFSGRSDGRRGEGQMARIMVAGRRALSKGGGGIIMGV